MKNRLLYHLTGGLIFLCACNNTSSEKVVAKKSSFELEKVNVVVESKTINTLAQIDGLKGKVKSVRKVTSHASTSAKSIKKVAEGNSYLTTYDKNGNGIERSYFNSKGKLQTKTVYQIDATYKCSKALMYQSNKSLLKTIQYAYNTSTNVVEEKHLAPNGKVMSRQVFKYNKAGQLLEEIKYKDQDVFEMKTEYAYNTKGDAVSTKFFKPINTLLIDVNTTYETFDTQGNWLRCIERTNKGSMFLVERIISYY